MIDIRPTVVPMLEPQALAGRRLELPNAEERVRRRIALAGG
jgi:hypothetical protein